MGTIKQPAVVPDRTLTVRAAGQGEIAPPSGDAVQAQQPRKPDFRALVPTAADR